MKRTMTIQLSALVTALAIIAVPALASHAATRGGCVTTTVSSPAYIRPVNVRPAPNADLQIWIWPDRGEGATYLDGDEIRINVEATKSCFLVIYDIDTRGNLRVLFPNDPWDDNFVQGGEIVTFPREWDGYDWTVEGPSGTEYVQAIASEFPIGLPDWPVYMNSVNYGGAVSLDPQLRDFRSGWDRLDYIRTVNRKITGRFWDWCATDLASFEVRPRYHYRTWYEPDPWPDVFYGEIYIGWPIGGAIFIDNVYIGVAPLWVPRGYYRGQHVLVCRQGRREVRRQNIRFYPKRSFTFDNDRYNRRVVIDNGHMKPGRRGGPETFRREIKQELRERESRRDRKPSVTTTSRQQTDRSVHRKTTDVRVRQSPTERNDQNRKVTVTRETSRSVESSRPAPKPGKVSGTKGKRSKKVERSVKFSAQKDKGDKGFKRSTSTGSTSASKVVTKTKSVKKVKVASKQRGGGSKTEAAKVSKSKSTKKSKTKPRSTTGKRSR